MNLFEVVVRILISQLLRGSTPRADNAKACFWWQIVPRFWGSFFAIFGDFRGVNVKFCVFDPQKALPYPKRHLSVYFMKLSDKRCRLHPSSRTPKRWKNAIEAVYVGYLPASDPLCKCYETWHGGSCRVRNRSDRCWSTPVNRFRCARHQSWVPSIDKAHRAYYTAVPATAGTHDEAVVYSVVFFYIFFLNCREKVRQLSAQSTWLTGPPPGRIKEVYCSFAELSTNCHQPSWLLTNNNYVFMDEGPSVFSTLRRCFDWNVNGRDLRGNIARFAVQLFIWLGCGLRSKKK